MKYRILGLLGVMALTAGSLLAQDYDDIYYDASKAPKTTKVKVETPVKTAAVYGDVPEKYKVVVKDNYREERDVDEYNRRGAYEPQYEIDINGDTIYMDSTYVDDDMFANTRRIERFYNPDIVILSDDDDLVELYYDESPTINLIVGSDWSYASYGWSTSYYPWYTGWYTPWYDRYFDPWYYSPWHYGWYTPYNFGYWSSYYWGWNYHPWWSYRSWYWSGSHWGWHGGHHYADWGTHRPGGKPHYGNNLYTDHRRGGLASNRNGRSRVDATGSRNQISSRGSGSSRSSGVGLPGSRNRSGGVSSRSGNMGSRNSSGVSTRSSSYSGGSRSSSGSRSSGSYSGGSRSSSSSSSSGSSRSYSSGSSHSSGSYSSGSSGGSRSSGGGSHGGSSGGGGRRR